MSLFGLLDSHCLILLRMRNVNLFKFHPDTYTKSTACKVICREIRIWGMVSQSPGEEDQLGIIHPDVWNPMRNSSSITSLVCLLPRHKLRNRGLQPIVNGYCEPVLLVLVRTERPVHGNIRRNIKWSGTQTNGEESHPINSLQME